MNLRYSKGLLDSNQLTMNILTKEIEAIENRLSALREDDLLNELALQSELVSIMKVKSLLKFGFTELARLQEEK